MHGVLNLMDEMSELSDKQVIVLLNKGNPDAFMELTSRYMALIRAKAASLRGSGMEADDLCQEGLLGLLSAAHSYREEGAASFKTYAGICIYRQMVTACRGAANRKNLPLNHFISLNDAQEDPTLNASFVSAQTQATDPETLLIDRENMQALKDRINRTLSKMEQQVLFLYLGGCSYGEIAGKLSVSVKAADNAIQRVRRKLKESF